MSDLVNNKGTTVIVPTPGADISTKVPGSNLVIPRVTMICKDGKKRTESLPQASAYLIWRASGAVAGNGIVNLIADHPRIKTTARTVYGWMRLYEWKRRAKEDKNLSTDDISTYLWGGFDAESIGSILDDTRTEEELENDGALSKVEYRRVIRRAIKDFIDALEAGRVKIETVADMERLAKLDRFLQGDTEEINTQINIITGIPRPAPASAIRELDLPKAIAKGQNLKVAGVGVRGK